jgi:hypothetical protein
LAAQHQAVPEVRQKGDKKGLHGTIFLDLPTSIMYSLFGVFYGIAVIFALKPET